MQDFINEKKAAEMLDCSVQKLRNDRCKGVGLHYYKLAKSVRYRVRDILQYMEAHRIETVD